MSAGPRIGIVGAGGVAARHAAVLGGLGASVVAVADPELGRAQALASEHGATAYPSHGELLAAGGLDAVYVCVPPFAHGAPERDVAAAGLPLFVEKPLALDRATAEEVGVVVEASGVPTATGYHWRCLDTVAAARQVLAERPPRLLQAAWIDKVPPPAWWRRRDRSGGQVVEQATHVLDLLRVLGGEVEEVTAASAIRTERPDFPDADVDDVTTATLRFASGALGTLVASCLPSTKHRAGVEVVSDGLVLELSETVLSATGLGGAEVRTPVVDGREQVDRDFLAAIAGDRDAVLAPYGDALRTHRLACAIVDAAASGAPVRLA